jgi:DNA-binding NarL/FixJ family response regulator
VRLLSRRGSSWSLPVTASDEEQFLATDEEPLVRREGLVIIHARQFEMQDWLSAACRRRGYSTVWLQEGRSMRVKGAKAAIFDFGGNVDHEVDDLELLARRLHPSPIVALLNFPRLDERDRVLAAGAAAVLSKPLLVADLLEQLDSLTHG